MYPNKKYKQGFQTQLIFKISLHAKEWDLLSKIKSYFGVGSITKHGLNTIEYRITTLKYMDKVITHFDNYPLLSQKQGDFVLFKRAVDLLKTKQHLNSESFKEILMIRASMNLGLSAQLKQAFPGILPFERVKVTNLVIKDPHWFSGFTSGEGCFFISIFKSETSKLGENVTLKFHIAQHFRDSELLNQFVTQFGCGRVEVNSKKTAAYFVVTKFNDITNIIIPLFENYPILGIKALDFKSFSKAAKLMENKTHLTEKGLSEIRSIKSEMNFQRTKFDD